MRNRLFASFLIIAITVTGCGGGSSDSTAKKEDAPTSLNLNGAVAGVHLPYAEVEIYCGDNLVGSTTADVAGEYTVTITVLSDDRHKSCSAVATKGAVKLVSLLDSTATLESFSDEAGSVSGEALPDLNITNVTTAKVAVITQLLGGELPVNDSEYEAQLQLIREDETLQQAIIQSASVLKAVVDVPSVSIASGYSDTQTLVEAVAAEVVTNHQSDPSYVVDISSHVVLDPSDTQTVLEEIYQAAYTAVISDAVQATGIPSSIDWSQLTGGYYGYGNIYLEFTPDSANPTGGGTALVWETAAALFGDAEVATYDYTTVGDVLTLQKSSGTADRQLVATYKSGYGNKFVFSLSDSARPNRYYWSMVKTLDVNTAGVNMPALFFTDYNYGGFNIKGCAGENGSSVHLKSEYYNNTSIPGHADLVCQQSSVAQNGSDKFFQLTATLPGTNTPAPYQFVLLLTANPADTANLPVPTVTDYYYTGPHVDGIVVKRVTYLNDGGETTYYGDSSYNKRVAINNSLPLADTVFFQYVTGDGNSILVNGGDIGGGVTNTALRFNADGFPAEPSTVNYALLPAGNSSPNGWYYPVDVLVKAESPGQPTDPVASDLLHMGPNVIQLYGLSSIAFDTATVLGVNSISPNESHRAGMGETWSMERISVAEVSGKSLIFYHWFDDEPITFSFASDGSGRSSDGYAFSYTTDPSSGTLKVTSQYNIFNENPGPNNSNYIFERRFYRGMFWYDAADDSGAYGTLNTYDGLTLGSYNYLLNMNGERRLNQVNMYDDVELVDYISPESFDVVTSLAAFHSGVFNTDSYQWRFDDTPLKIGALDGFLGERVLLDDSGSVVEGSEQLLIWGLASTDQDRASDFSNDAILISMVNGSLLEGYSLDDVGYSIEYLAGDLASEFVGEISCYDKSLNIICNRNEMISVVPQ